MTADDIDPLADFDPALFAPWDAAPVYSPGRPGTDDDPALMGLAKSVILELKSADARQNQADADRDMRLILNEVTVEMRDQFTAFRSLRSDAETLLRDGDDAGQKLARADIKAATDAMSLIVRTLEKIDSLQRQFARDREIEAERAEDEGGYEQAKARFARMIEERADEKAYRLYEAWKRDGPPGGTAAEKHERAPPQPADAPPGG